MDTLLQVKDLGFSYDGSRQIFKDISFEVQAGEIVCLLGPNGIGKTTLLNCLARLREPLEGSVLLNGEEMANLSARNIAQTMGTCPRLCCHRSTTPCSNMWSRTPLAGHLRNLVRNLSTC